MHTPKVCDAYPTQLSLAKLNLKAIRTMQIRENFQQIYAAEGTRSIQVNFPVFFILRALNFDNRALQIT